MLYVSTPSPRGSHDKCPIEVNARLGAMVFGAREVVLSQKVEAKAIFARSKKREKLPTQLDPKRVGQVALKDRELHPLSIALAGFGDSSEASPAFLRLGGNVVCDKDDHGAGSARWMEGREHFHVAAERPRQQAGLDVGHQAPANLLPQQRMDDGGCLALLVTADHQLPRLVC